jgi:hypothetical protein
MISEDEARVIAQGYLERGSPGFTFSFYPTPQKRSDDWSMVFDWGTGDGSVFDGPIIVLVDKQTGKARSLAEDIEEKSSRG